jgi:hypothetical protein
MPLFYVVPDLSHWGEEWATFCAAEQAQDACTYALQQQDDSRLVDLPKWKKAKRAVTVGADTWAVYEVSAIPKRSLKKPGAVPWSDIPRTDWKLQ